MTWNIGQGAELEGGEAVTLPLIAARIRSEAADLVLLNEVRVSNGWPFGSGVNQAKELAGLTGLGHVQWRYTTPTGLTGFIAVAVLSRWPLGAPSMHLVPAGWARTPAGRVGAPVPGAYGILRTSVRADGLNHALFSLRFNAWSNEEQELGLKLLAELVSAVPASDAVIAAGDFNCGFVYEVEFPPLKPYFEWFAQRSGLRNALTERRDPPVCNPENVIDHIFFRGPYELRRTRRRCDLPHPTEHPWICADLERRRPVDAAGVLLLLLLDGTADRDSDAPSWLLPIL